MPIKNQKFFSAAAVVIFQSVFDRASQLILSAQGEPMEAQMNNSPRFASIAECPAQIRFVLVNGRVPRTDATCALCALKIKNEYVHARQTGLIYCDMQCFAEHEKMTVLAFKEDVRKVS